MNLKNLAFHIYFGALIMLAAALPFWLLLMSLSQFALAGAWLLHGNIKGKLKSALQNKALLAVLGVYILHVAGVFYSTDIDYALDDLRVKLPLLLLPLIVATMPPLNRDQFEWILKVAVAAVVASTLCSVAVLAGVTGKSIENIRDISMFISHIRLSLLICMSIVICIYFLRRGVALQWRIGLSLVILWLTAFLFLLQSLTGLAILSILCITSLVVLLFHSSSKVLRSAAALILIISAVGIASLYKYLFVDSVQPLVVDGKSLKENTALGNPYIHYPEKNDHENGHPVWININEEELRMAWNERSNFNYDSLDLRNQEIKYTLIRFLSSCGYLKDAEGVNQLTGDEVRAIENGIANRDYMHKSGVGIRLRQLAWEYRSYYYSNNPSGHSVMQRLEFWKTGLYIFRNNALTGIGTGDVKTAYAQAYEELDSKLLPAFRLRAHNEYLTMFLTFGVAGGAYFIFSLIYPYIKLKKRRDFLYTGFIIILCLSMVMEDTPESQPGATFMAFFNGILLFHQFGRLNE